MSKQPTLKQRLARNPDAKHTGTFQAAVFALWNADGDRILEGLRAECVASTTATGAYWLSQPKPRD